MGDGNVMFDSVNLKSVNKSYGVKQALKNINLNIESGKIVGLLGPNGSGKTTMIKLINCLKICRYLINLR